MPAESVASSSANRTGAEFEQQVSAVLRFLSRRMQRREDAQDLAQEVFLRLSARGGREAPRDPYRYVLGIASNVLADFKRQAFSDERHVVVDSELADASAHRESNWLSDDMADRAHLQQVLLRGLRQLPPQQQAILILHKREGLSLKEIADKLGLSLFTVKIYLTRAKAHFRSLKWDW